MFNNFVDGERYEPCKNREYSDVRRQIIDDRSMILEKEIVWDTDLFIEAPKKKIKKK